MVHDVPGFLDLLRDMSSYNPANRICAAEALARFRIPRSSLQCEDLVRTQEREIFSFQGAFGACSLILCKRVG